MNILPKKRWHVRTKDNIARVRRDEAQAAEQEQERLRRVALAEQEFRTSILRKQAAERRGEIGGTSGEQQAKLEPGQDVAKKEKDASIVGASGHINFFSHLEDGERVAGPNEDYVREQKEEKEKYEKSIGYLTYLGQGSREETKQKAWFEKLPVDRQKERQQVGDEEVKRKSKALEDPLMVVKKLVGVDRSDIPAASSAKPTTAAPVPILQHHPSKNIAAADAQKRSPDSGATDRHSAKKRKKHAKHDKREARVKTKKNKHSKKRKRDDSGDRRHAKSKKRGRRSPSSGDSGSSASDGGAEEAEVRRIRLERLRAERLQRERQERQRAEQLLSRLRGEQLPPAPERAAPPEPSLKRRYNAQFNPYLARQNYRQN